MEFSSGALALFKGPHCSLAIAVGIILPGLSSGASLLLLSYFQVILENSPALASVKMMPWTLILLYPLVGHLVAS